MKSKSKPKFSISYSRGKPTSTKRHIFYSVETILVPQESSRFRISVFLVKAFSKSDAEGQVKRYLEGFGTDFPYKVESLDATLVEIDPSSKEAFLPELLFTATLQAKPNKREEAYRGKSIKKEAKSNPRKTLSNSKGKRSTKG